MNYFNDVSILKDMSDPSIIIVIMHGKFDINLLDGFRQLFYNQSKYTDKI